MTKITKIVASALVLGAASSAVAHEAGPKVTLSGDLDTQFGYRSEKAAFDVNAGGQTDTQGAAQRIHKFAIVNDTDVKIKVDGHGKGFKYGGKIVLNADTSDSKYNDKAVARQTMMYVESNMGRVEAGSYTGSYEAMNVNAGSLARATGGISGDATYWLNQTNMGKFINQPSLPTASGDMDSVANAAKVTYYTPSYAGFKAGVTFTPDTEQHGTVTQTRFVSRNYYNGAAPATGQNTGDSRANGYKNVLQGGVSYHGKMDKVHLKVAALGEMGDAKKAKETTRFYDRHDLRAFEVGATVSYMGFGVGGSYGDWGKSGLFKTRLANNTAVGGKKSSNYWTAGVNYVHNHWGASVTYISSKTHGQGFAAGATTSAYSTQKGQASFVSVGLDYKLAPGFMPYAEVTFFNTKDKSLAVGDALRKDSGTVVLAGSKLSF